MYEIGAGVTVSVVAPPVPLASVLPPVQLPVYVVPVAGPQGPPGPAGDVESVTDLIEDAVTVHVEASEPHPAYDDLPSLSLLFDNGLV